MYDCYYDASYYLESKSGIAAVYLENEQGEKIVEKQFPFEHIASSQQAEQFALEKAFLVSQDYPNAFIRFLGDCKSVIEGIWEERESFLSLKDDMKKQGICMNQLVWIYREYNKAHPLTQPAHIEQERPIYEVDVRYKLKSEAYQQYIIISAKQQPKPFALIEKKLNRHIEEASYFSIQLKNKATAFFRYGFIIFTEKDEIVSIYKSEDNKNQYGICKKQPNKLEGLYAQLQYEKNQA